MLSARLDGQLILVHERHWADQEAALRAASRAGRLVAPCCGAPLVLRWGERKVRHFAHPPKRECPYERWSEPESAEHAQGKVRLYEWCRQHLGSGLRLLELEHPLPATLQRPDVYLELTDGTRYALEYQRSAISPGEWRERHEAYSSQGIHALWIFGENRLADALPTAEQQARWSRQEPHMHFLKLRAFETESAVRTPFEVAWWRGEQQEELWAPQELDARVGRDVSPWYRRAALARLRSVTFLDAGTGELHIYRGMRELPRHTDTQMASVRLQAALADGVTLTPYGFATEADRARLAAYEERVARLEAALRRAPAPVAATAEAAAPYVALVAPPPHLPSAWADAWEQRSRLRWPADVDSRLFGPAEQEEEQRRRLQVRAEHPDWRRIVDRFGLAPESLHLLVGIPIVDDTIIQVHRTVWQAFICYWFLADLRRGFAVQHLITALERRYGVDREMNRVARFILPGRVATPADVVARFLNLLVDLGYLRNDMESELFWYHPAQSPPPILAFADRAQRWAAWNGLLRRQLKLEGTQLSGDAAPIMLLPVRGKGFRRR